MAACPTKTAWCSSTAPACTAPPGGRGRSARWRGSRRRARWRGWCSSTPTTSCWWARAPRRFALSYGFKEEDLLTPESRQKWLIWRANRGPDDDWLEVPDNEPMVVRPTGTINLNVVNPSGDISSITTTSGLAWKIPGPRGRLADRGRRPVHRQRDRRRRLHRARRVEHHGVRRIPDGGAHAARTEAHRRLPGDAEAGGGDVTLPG